MQAMPHRISQKATNHTFRYCPVARGKVVVPRPQRPWSQAAISTPHYQILLHPKILHENPFSLLPAPPFRGSSGGAIALKIVASWSSQEWAWLWTLSWDQLMSRDDFVVVVSLEGSGLETRERSLCYIFVRYLRGLTLHKIWQNTIGGYMCSCN